MADINDYLSVLEEQKNTEKSAAEDTYNTYIDTINQQKQDLTNQYKTARTDAYATGRISALGNNEQLANVGLAGNAYSAPKSGYSETSRITQDVNLQNTLNSLSAEERSVSLTLAQSLAEAYSTKSSALADIQSTYLSNAASYAQTQQSNAVSMAQEYASNGLDLPENYKQSYKAATGEDYSALLKQTNSAKYNYYYTLNDTEKTDYDQIFNSSLNTATQLDNFANAYFSDNGISSEEAAKLLSASSTGLTYSEVLGELVASGYISESNVDKATELLKNLNVSSEYDISSAVVKGLIEQGVANKSGYVTQGKTSYAVGNSAESSDITNSANKVITSGKIGANVKLNGEKVSSELTSANTYSNGDILTINDTLLKKGWDSYVYYGGSWYSLSKV